MKTEPIYKVYSRGKCFGIITEGTGNKTVICIHIQAASSFRKKVETSGLFRIRCIHFQSMKLGKRNTIKILSGRHIEFSAHKIGQHCQKLHED